MCMVQICLAHQKPPPRVGGQNTCSVQIITKICVKSIRSSGPNSTTARRGFVFLLAIWATRCSCSTRCLGGSRLMSRCNLHPSRPAQRLCCPCTAAETHHGDPARFTPGQLIPPRYKWRFAVINNSVSIVLSPLRYAQSDGSASYEFF